MVRRVCGELLILWEISNSPHTGYGANKGAALRDLRKSLAWAATRPLGLKIE